LDEKDASSIVSLASKLTAETYQQLRTALELGKWADGRKLNAEQKESSLQLIIAYDQIHNEEQDRVGFVNKAKKKEPCAGDDKPSGDGADNDERPVKFL